MSEKNYILIKKNEVKQIYFSYLFSSRIRHEQNCFKVSEDFIG